jgi:hypothetical protein
VALWPRETGAKSFHNGVLGIGVDSTEARCSRTVREAWVGESGKDECIRAEVGPEAAYCRGTEFSRMGGYDFPGQIAASDGSEGKGAMGAAFIVMGNPGATGSARVGRTEEGTDSTRAEMADLLEVLVGANVKENLIVMVDNQ